MVLIIKKGASNKELVDIENKLLVKTKGFDADKYNGAIKIKIDSLMFQKQLRDEWERDFNRY